MNELNKIKLGQQAREHQVNPSAQVWNRLQQKLVSNKLKDTKTKVFYFKPIYSFLAAASLAVILTVTVLMNEKSNQNTQNQFAMLTIDQTEDITFTNDRNIYQISQLNTLKAAYKKLSAQQ